MVLSRGCEIYFFKALHSFEKACMTSSTEFGVLEGVGKSCVGVCHFFSSIPGHQDSERAGGASSCCKWVHLKLLSEVLLFFPGHCALHAKSWC